MVAGPRSSGGLPTMMQTRTRVFADAVAAGALPDDRHQQDSDKSATAVPQLWMVIVRGPDGRRYPALAR